MIKIDELIAFLVSIKIKYSDINFYYDFFKKLIIVKLQNLIK